VGLDVLSRHVFVSLPDRNRFGAIAYEPHGTSTVPRSFTQAFTNGELWGITTEFFLNHQNEIVVPAGNVESICGRVLENFCMMAKDGFGIEPPYQIELGAIGLTGVYLGIGRDKMAGPFHLDQLKIRRPLIAVSASARQKLIDDFLNALFDLAGEDRQ
jgi:hypothetical protein